MPVCATLVDTRGRSWTTHPRRWRVTPFDLWVDSQRSLPLAELGASPVAGIIWTAVSPTAAFVYLAAWMLVALVVLVSQLPEAAR